MSNLQLPATLNAVTSNSSQRGARADGNADRSDPALAFDEVMQRHGGRESRPGDVERTRTTAPAREQARPAERTAPTEVPRPAQPATKRDAANAQPPIARNERTAPVNDNAPAQDNAVNAPRDAGTGPTAAAADTQASDTATGDLFTDLGLALAAGGKPAAPLELAAAGILPSDTHAAEGEIDVQARPVASALALASALATDTLPAQRTAPLADRDEGALPTRPGTRPRVVVAAADAALPKSADAAAPQQPLPIEGRPSGFAAVESEFSQLAATLDARGAPAARSEPIAGTPLSLSAALSAGAGAALGTTAPATFTLGHAQVATPVGAHGFNDDFSQRVLMLAGQRVQSAEIALTPADLGPISVSMELRGQEASLVFGAAQSATRLAIEDALPRLREMFQTHGLHLVDAHVGAQVGHQNRRDSGTGSPRDTRNALDARGSPIGEVGGAAASTTVLSRTNRLIDVRV